MRQKAVVKSTDSKTATVVINRRTMCDGCSKADCNGSCTVGNMFGGSSEMTAVALNNVGAEVGDIVELESETSGVLLSAALVFIFPIITAFLFYGVMSYFGNTESTSLIAALIGFLIAFAVIGIYERFFMKNKIKIQIVKIVDHCESGV